MLLAGIEIGLHAVAAAFMKATDARSSADTM